MCLGTLFLTLAENRVSFCGEWHFSLRAGNNEFISRTGKRVNFSLNFFCSSETVSRQFSAAIKELLLKDANPRKSIPWRSRFSGLTGFLGKMKAFALICKCNLYQNPLLLPKTIKIILISLVWFSREKMYTVFQKNIFTYVLLTAPHSAKWVLHSFSLLPKIIVFPILPPAFPTNAAQTQSPTNANLIEPIHFSLRKIKILLEKLLETHWVSEGARYQRANTTFQMLQTLFCFIGR